MAVTETSFLEAEVVVIAVAMVNHHGEKVLIEEIKIKEIAMTVKMKMTIETMGQVIGQVVTEVVILVVVGRVVPAAEEPTVEVKT